MDYKNVDPFKWAFLLMVMGPAYYWWDYPAPIFIAGIFFYVDSLYTGFVRLLATSVLVIRSSILEKDKKDESKAESLHG